MMNFDLPKSLVDQEFFSELDSEEKDAFISRFYLIEEIIFKIERYTNGLSSESIGEFLEDFELDISSVQVYHSGDGPKISSWQIHSNWKLDVSGFHQYLDIELMEELGRNTITHKSGPNDIPKWLRCRKEWLNKEISEFKLASSASKAVACIFTLDAILAKIQFEVFTLRLSRWWV